jgi:hypothetical protein
MRFDGGCSGLNRFLSIKVQFHGMNIQVLSMELLCGCLAGGGVPRAQKDQKSGLSQLARSDPEARIALRPEMGSSQPPSGETGPTAALAGKRNPFPSACLGRGECFEAKSYLAAPSMPSMERFPSWHAYS